MPLEFFFSTTIVYLCLVGLFSGLLVWLGFTVVFVPRFVLLPVGLVPGFLLLARVPSDEDSLSELSDEPSVMTSATASVSPPVVFPLFSLSVFLQAANAKMVATTRSNAKILFIFFPPKESFIWFFNTVIIFLHGILPLLYQRAGS